MFLCDYLKSEPENQSSCHLCKTSYQDTDSDKTGNTNEGIQHANINEPGVDLSGAMTAGVSSAGCVSTEGRLEPMMLITVLGL